jgi:IS5 family transposase
VFIDQLIKPNHRYRKFIEILDFEGISDILTPLISDNQFKGYGILRLFKCLFLQVLEDLSDRELEVFLEENNAAKWFCGFNIGEKTPDYSLFSKIRKKIGIKLLADIFKQFRNQLKAKGFMNEIFTFVDATHLIARAQVWDERDKALKDKQKTLNNTNINKYAKDKDLRIGAKSKRKFWIGYKKSVSVDMRSGLINKVAVTKANKTDADAMKHVCPSQGAVFADKGYAHCEKTAKKKGLHLCAIQKDNNKLKNRDKDKWISKMRSPYERVFSKENKRCRYRGLLKNQWTGFMQSLTFNVKRMLALKEEYCLT